eukprot:scaffold23194_cov30-Tisochrysis_lutea.AAC.5
MLPRERLELVDHRPRLLPAAEVPREFIDQWLKRDKEAERQLRKELLVEGVAVAHANLEQHRAAHVGEHGEGALRCEVRHVHREGERRHRSEVGERESKNDAPGGREEDGKCGTRIDYLVPSILHRGHTECAVKPSRRRASQRGGEEGLEEKARKEEERDGQREKVEVVGDKQRVGGRPRPPQRRDDVRRDSQAGG